MVKRKPLQGSNSDIIFQQIYLGRKPQTPGLDSVSSCNSLICNISPKLLSFKILNHVNHLYFIFIQKYFLYLDYNEIPTLIQFDLQYFFYLKRERKNFHLIKCDISY